MTARGHDQQCPVAGCSAVLEPWQRLCGGCLRRLPGDMRGRFFAAGAPHLRSAVVIEAVAWLGAHAPALAAARVLGERPG